MDINQTFHAAGISPDTAFVAISRSGARHVVDPVAGRYRRSHAGSTDEWPLFAVLGEVGLGRSLLVLVVGEADQVIALHSTPVEYLAPLHPISPGRRPSASTAQRATAVAA